MFTTHQLRHTFATMLCRNTSDLKAIQKIMGHADISTTMNVYADATEEGVNDSMKALEGVILKTLWDTESHSVYSYLLISL